MALPDALTTPVAPPAEPGEPLDPPAPPVAGETFNAVPTGGDVLVRRPQDGALIPLEQGASLPVGSRLDVRQGSVVVDAAPARGATQQEAAFTGAMFKVAQPRRGSRIVTLDLNHGDFESCANLAQRSRAATARAAARRSERSVRRLFGRGKGRFRTRGRHAAATVRGTTWIVEDRCDATVTAVREGVVDVEDFGTGRTVAVRAGRQLVSRPGRPPLLQRLSPAAG